MGRQIKIFSSFWNNWMHRVETACYRIKQCVTLHTVTIIKIKNSILFIAATWKKGYCVLYKNARNWIDSPMMMTYHLLWYHVVEPIHLPADQIWKVVVFNEKSHLCLRIFYCILKCLIFASQTRSSAKLIAKLIAQNKREFLLESWNIWSSFALLNIKFKYNIRFFFQMIVHIIDISIDFWLIFNCFLSYPYYYIIIIYFNFCV